MKVAIIGGGVAGLSAALHSRAQGHDVTLHEKQERVGGRIWESRKNGYTFEMGPSMITELWVFDELFKAAGKNNPLTFSETPDFGFCIHRLLKVNRTDFSSVLDDHDRQL
ncbi:MAG: FAD-dependent oxidoreductase, partial [Spirochaetota bacterium]